MNRKMILLALIFVALAVTSVASAQYNAITKAEVEALGGNGQRYHAADDFEVTDWSVFGGQSRYNPATPQMLDGYQKSTAGELGLSLVWNECRNNQACKVVLSPNEVILYLGNYYYLDNCTWHIGGKRIPFKNRVTPVTPPPAPPAPQPEPPKAEPPPPPAPPTPEPPAPPPVVIRPVPPETPVEKVECPKCLKVEVKKLDKKGKVLKFTAVTSGHVSGNWQTQDGRNIGNGNGLIISYQRLEKLFGKKKGTHVIRFVGKDADGHEVVCGREIEIRRHGRFWLFKIPGLNCLYAWSADITNWSAGGAIEKGACAAAGVGIYFLLGEAGVVAGKTLIPIISIH